MANEQPLWKREVSGRAFFIYSTLDKAWAVGGQDMEEVDFKSNGAFIVSAKHKGGMPNRLGSSEWKWYDFDTQKFISDKTVDVDDASTSPEAMLWRADNTWLQELVHEPDQWQEKCEGSAVMLQNRSSGAVRLAMYNGREDLGNLCTTLQVAQDGAVCQMQTQISTATCWVWKSPGGGYFAIGIETAAPAKAFEKAFHRVTAAELQAAEQRATEQRARSFAEKVTKAKWRKTAEAAAAKAVEALAKEGPTSAAASGRVTKTEDTATETKSRPECLARSLETAEVAQHSAAQVEEGRQAREREAESKATAEKELRTTLQAATAKLTEVEIKIGGKAMGAAGHSSVPTAHALSTAQLNGDKVGNVVLEAESPEKNVFDMSRDDDGDSSDSGRSGADELDMWLRTTAKGHLMTISRPELVGMSTRDLRAQCAERLLNKTGRKMELVERVLRYDEESEKMVAKSSTGARDNAEKRRDPHDGVARTLDALVRDCVCAPSSPEYSVQEVLDYWETLETLNEDATDNDAEAGDEASEAGEARAGDETGEADEAGAGDETGEAGNAGGAEADNETGEVEAEITEAELTEEAAWAQAGEEEPTAAEVTYAAEPADEEEPVGAELNALAEVGQDSEEEPTAAEADEEEPEADEAEESHEEFSDSSHGSSD